MNQETVFVSEIFDSIQGETTLAGIMTSFIRLAGCPLRCAWCDSTYTFGKGTEKTIDELVNIVTDNGWKNICITGGEPLAQTATISLLTTLVSHGFSVSIETSGSLPIQAISKEIKIILDLKPPSSTMCGKNLYENIDHIKNSDEIKFVIGNRIDYEWAKATLLKYDLFSKVSTILFSPVWGLLHPKMLIEWIRQDKLSVRLNIQIHKFIWDETTKGV